MERVDELEKLVSQMLEETPGSLSAMVVRREDHTVVAGKTYDLRHTPQTIGQDYASLWEQVNQDIISIFGPGDKIKNLVIMSEQLNAAVFPSQTKHIVCLESASPKAAGHMFCIHDRWVKRGEEGGHHGQEPC